MHIFNMCIHANPFRCSIQINYAKIEVKIYDVSGYGTAYHKFIFVDQDLFGFKEMEKEIEEILECE